MTKEQEIYQAAIDEGLTPTLANLMVAQSKHESGANYTNTASRLYNNAFGYKYVGQKIYDSNGNNVVSRGNISSEGNSYAAYTSIYWSAVEAARWVKRKIPDYNNIKTPEQYAAALKSKGYYGDPVSVYTGGLKRYFTQVVEATKEYVKNNPIKTVVVVSVVAAMASYWIWIMIRKK